MNTHSSAQSHVLPLSIYLGIGGLLLVLTGLTVWVALDFHFGPFNLVVAMLIAGVKATLVALFFMHLKYDNKLYMIVFVGAIVFLALFVILTMFDTMRRDDIYSVGAQPIQQAEIYHNQTPAAGAQGADSAASAPATHNAPVSPGE